MPTAEAINHGQPSAPSVGTALAAPVSDRVLRRTMLVLILGSVMTEVDATVTNVALRTLGHDLRSPVVDVQWVITAYLLGLSVVIPVSGWLVRRFGARRVYTVAMAMFTLASALCATASSLAALIAFRALQGMAGGGINPVVQLIAAESSGPRRAGTTLSRVWVVTSMATIVGPALGGVLIDGPGWQWIFLINVPLGALATTAAFLMLPDTPARPAGPLDCSGLLRLSVGIPSLIFGLARAQASGGLTSPATMLPLVVGLLLIIDFIRHALGRERPLLEVRLYRRGAFALGTLSLLSYTVAAYGLYLLLPLYFQQTRHLSAALAGLLIAPQAMGSAIGMSISGRIREPGHIARNAAIGLLLMTGTTMSLAYISPRAPYWAICPILFVAGVCGGTAWIASITATYSDLGGSEISHASPLVSLMIRIGGAAGTVLAAVALQHQLNGNRAASAEAHLAAAYHASFRWEAMVVLIACGVYVVLTWSTSSRRAGPLRMASQSRRGEGGPI